MLIHVSKRGLKISWWPTLFPKNTTAHAHKFTEKDRAQTFGQTHKENRTNAQLISGFYNGIEKCVLNKFWP